MAVLQAITVFCFCASDVCMRELIKSILWVGCLALGLQSAWAFSLLGPSAAYTGVPAGFGDVYEITEIGYNPLPATDAAYGITDDNDIGPKNQGEGYRRNTAVLYYAFSPTFSDYFGSNGEYAAQQAFDILNGAFNGQTNAPLFLNSPNNGVLGDTNGSPAILLNATNSVDIYSTGLTEFPLDSEEINYQAQVLGLQDVKSFTLAILAEEMGLADPVRYTWGLHTRAHVGAIPCPVGQEYSVVQRNFDISPSPVNQLQYSSYVNDELYSYFIYENCDAPLVSPPGAAALPIPADPLVNNRPVASGGAGLDFLGIGSFYTGLTRDDIAGLRWLYSTNNYDTPSSGYQESPAAGSTLFAYGTPQLLSTSNYNALVAMSLTNNPGTMAGLFPGIQFTYLTNYFSNVVSATMSYVTNFPYGGVSGQGYVGLQTTYSTNLVDFFQYTFGNVITNKAFPTTTYQYQTITFGPPIGWPVGSAPVTNVSLSQPFQSNVPSGDFFVITNGECPPNFLQTLQTNVNIITNTIAATTNADGTFIIQNLISYFTNYTFSVLPCALATNRIETYQGIGRIQFIRVRDDNYDYLLGQFITPITNQYTMVALTNGQFVTQTFQRVVTTPDFLFEANDAASGPGGLPGSQNGVSRGEVFNLANIQPLLAGPGTIDPPTVLGFNKVGVLYENTGPSFLNQAGGAQFFLWGSFDGTTNAPVVYPNGTDLVNLMNEALVQIAPLPPNLPNGTKGVAYNVAFSATGTSGAVTWTLAPISAGLPPGLGLSAGGVLSGTPTQSGTFDNIVIQMTDSSTPPRVVNTGYSLTIN